jgi:hypothetical protein
MGIHKYMSLTPYLEVIGEKTVTEMEVKRICPTHPKKDVGNAKFCSECGALIINEDKPKITKFTPVGFYHYEMAENLEDDVWSVEGEENCFLPNSTPPSKIPVEEHANEFIDLSSPEMAVKISADILWFKKKYAKLIAAFDKEFGEEYVKVRWGAVQYWS